LLIDARTHGLWQRTAPAAAPVHALAADVTADAVIIGAGYTGLSTALHLRQRGVSVIVIEASDIGYGGSGRNVGLVNAGLWVTPEVLLRRLGPVFGERLIGLLSDAPGLVFDLVARHAIDCEATRAGTLHCAVGRSGLEELEQRAAQWIARGVPVQLLGASETSARTGSAGRHAYAGALFDARAGTVQPLAYVRGLARAALAGGARVFVQSPALSATRDAGTWTVSTPGGRVSAQWIVVATDAYAHGPWQIVREEQVRLPYFNLATAPLDPGVRESVLPRREGAWDTRQALSSFRLDAAGRLIFGSVGSLRGRAAGVHEAWARRALRRIFPQLGEVGFEATWYGHIGMTNDNLPRFHVFAPNVIGFNGYNGRGIAPGTVFGRILAELIIGNLHYADLPLPVSQPRPCAARYLRERFYDIGAEALHLTAARF